jgi:NADH-quinone oxidoreductase subunit B
MGLIDHKFEDNFITTNVDRVLTWARENSLWPMGSAWHAARSR